MSILGRGEFIFDEAAVDESKGRRRFPHVPHCGAEGTADRWSA